LHYVLSLVGIAEQERGEVEHGRSVVLVKRCEACVEADSIECVVGYVSIVG
jgi:hypothetical protein